MKSMLLAAILFFIANVTLAQGIKLLMFEQDGCYWCEIWDHEIAAIYPKTLEGDVAPLQRIDIHSKLSTDIILKSSPQFTPTFIVVSNTGNDVLLNDDFNYLGQNHLNLFLLIFASLFFIFVFDKIRVPAALLSGTLFASGLLQITDIASYKLPDETVNFCLLILGSSVGCRFAEKTVKEIANNSLHSIVATTILVLLGLLAAYAATFFVDTNILTLILSFSPGGIYEVAVIAIAFDLDPDFVAFHHIIRLLFILFTVPIFLRILEKIKK